MSHGPELFTMGNGRSVAITNSSRERGGCMARMRDGLYSVQIESCVITLTLVSVLAITGELLINLHIVQVPPGSGEGDGGGTDNVSGIDLHSENNTSVGSPIDPGGTTSHPLTTAHLVFHYVSLIIASLFLLEIMLKMLVKGKKFFLKIFQVADALIVLGTFALEVVFTVEQEELPLLEAATYIIILRLWRVPYVCNIRAEECRQELVRELEVWQSAKHKLEERCHGMQLKIDKQQEQMRDMEKQLEKYSSKDKHVNTGKRAENGIKKDKGNKGPVSNGHIPHVRFSHHDEENGNHVILSSNHQSPVPVSVDDASINSIKSVETSDQTISDRKDNNPETVGQVIDNVDVQDETSPDRGPFSRCDSESSLSCDHVEQEVVVQIEGPPSPQHKLTTTDDTAKLISTQGQDKSPEKYSYSNAVFEEELGHHDLPVLHEIDGVKTYRSAEGIPMTSL